MEINKSITPEVCSLEIIGAVKTIDETREIRAILDEVVKSQPGLPIEMTMRETEVITSSLIGILIKLIYGENAQITIFTSSEKLYQLIERLNLVETLNIKKI